MLPASSMRLGLALVTDALRSNDPRLVAAAMGPFTAAHLGQAAWRQGVLKCLFTGIPLIAVTDLDRRADTELLRMVRDLAEQAPCRRTEDRHLTSPRCSVSPYHRWPRGRHQERTIPGWDPPDENSSIHTST